jgi:hypothetical protein
MGLYYQYVRQEERLAAFKSHEAMTGMVPSAEAYLAKLGEQIEKHPGRLQPKKELQTKLEIIAARINHEQGSKGLCFKCENYLHKDVRDEIPEDSIVCKKISPPMQFGEPPLVICLQYKPGDRVQQEAFEVMESESSGKVDCLKELWRKYRSQLENSGGSKQF